METSEKLQEELKKAMVSHDTFKLSVIRLIIGAIRNAEIEKKEKLDEVETISVIKKQAKQRRDSIEQYQSAGRTDLVEKEKAELELIGEYLPPELTDEELEKIVDEVISENQLTAINQMGLAVKAVMAKTNGQADGGKIAEVVKRKLS